MTLTVHFGQPAVEIQYTEQQLSIGTGQPIAREYIEREPYTGDYSIIPSANSQTLPTNGLRMTGDLTIEPIPSNYGLITWNGSVITVS